MLGWRPFAACLFAFPAAAAPPVHSNAGGLPECEATVAEAQADVDALGAALAATELALEQTEEQLGSTQRALEECEAALGDGPPDDPSDYPMNCGQLPEGSPTGNYVINPSNAGFLLQVHCQMDVADGGWTRLVTAVAGTLLPGVPKQYLYLKGDAWYRSPDTAQSWSWHEYTPVAGYYEWSDGTQSGGFSCDGAWDGEPFGVGCSDGPGGNEKVLPSYDKDPLRGTATVCQDLPDAFGTGACADEVAIYYRYTF